MHRMHCLKIQRSVSNGYGGEALTRIQYTKGNNFVENYGGYQAKGH